MTATELTIELGKLVDAHGDLDITAANIGQEYTLSAMKYVDGNLRIPSRLPLEERPPRFLLELKDSIRYEDD